MESVHPTSDAAAVQVRPLYAVPQRKVDRAEYVPVGRALHLVDVENLMGGPSTGIDQMVDALERYRIAAPFSAGDHVVIAANLAIALDAKVAWPEARLLARGGPDGADIALLEEVANVQFISTRYDTIVVGSGDGVFEVVAEVYRPLGLSVGIVSQRSRLSYALASSSSFVRFIPEAHDGEVAV
jgi:hypothetical protein